MAHIPHLYLPAPWLDRTLPLSTGQDHHLRRVLRLSNDDPVSYSDGRGTSGRGSLAAGGVVRGDERTDPAPRPRLTLAVAPPRGADRAREIVEKLAELGVERLVWLETRHGEARPPKPQRSGAWAVSALEQSRGAWLLEITERMPTGGTIWAALPGADPPGSVDGDLTILIGPEGGFEPEDVPPAAVPVGLGPRVLRVATAAVAAAVIGLDRLGRLANTSR